MFPLCQTPFQFAIWDVTQWLNAGGRQHVPAVITAQTQCENSWVFRFTGVCKYLICCSRRQKQFVSSRLFLSLQFPMKALPTTTDFANVYTFKWRYKVLVSSGSYPACGPSCSCSSQPGIVSHSRSGRLWCCKSWRSQSPSAWPCSPPTVEAGTSAEGERDSGAETLQLQRVLSVERPLLHPVNAVIWPCTFCQYGNELVTLYMRRHRTFIEFGTENWISFLTPWWIHVHSGAYCGSFSPTLLLFLFSLCAFIVLPTLHAGAE